MEFLWRRGGGIELAAGTTFAFVEGGHGYRGVRDGIKYTQAAFAIDE